ncbi:MAG: hypothetical protein A2161_21725 [Candidatus Schekmanbacteria bacterium RBG_13_48_7]|uniref:Uncharacterized protein n=1 Tax=Candidatus Schekmanbacteria bacterium RBG_13_48_7 TaxID=1817878 RepID=A0A1F7RS19_9BACT|nr:MAG: hypothetical protein A2161_21725 [Candidatus Schekmanbacteria bacterium RBG_13_48_7]
MALNTIAIVNVSVLELGISTNKFCFQELTRIPSSISILKEASMDDRRELVNSIFDALELTQGERDDVYESLINLVEARLKKAKSFKKK